MAGKKGRSGRKSVRDEEKRLRVIEKAWAYIESIIDNAEAPMILKADICKSIITKDIPQDLNLKGDALVTNVYNIINQVQRDFQTSRLSSVVLDSGNGLDE